MIGKILSLPVKVMNIVPRSIEKVVDHMCGEEDIREEERILSAPLSAIAKAIEEIDE